ncbi:hypothetical protein [Haloechinothrix halophila]|uniref:hypothetical protein n=1 Tax=Haloechinothrix halophila TaxID=1069073 RepID=UPI0004102389|nr:hypothetical protein [Haloechinothrix halophila]
MTEIMTFPEVPARSPDAPASEGSTFPVTIEGDATPLVRLIGRTLRDSARVGHADEVLGQSVGTVAVRSHDTPQAATVVLDGETVEVTSGVLVEPDATVVVDLHARFASAQEPTGDAALAAGTLRALRPPLPHWREAAQQFWEVTRGIPGIPEVLTVDAIGPDGSERGQFGDGATEYLMAGPPDLLAGVFSGADDFLASLAAGVQIKGTLSQMSVMTAASWKVRFDV